MSVIAPKLTRLALDIFDTVVDRYEAKFTRDECEKDTIRELKKCNLNDPEYITDIAKSLVRGTLAQRAKLNPFVLDKDGKLCPEKFSRREFKRGIIRLGDNFNVKMCDATAPEWLLRIQHQQRAANTAGEAALRTSQWLGTEPGVLLMQDYKLKTDMAMKQVAIDGWLWDVPVDDDDKSDDDGETED
jgi:hypothetical protein